MAAKFAYVNTSNRCVAAAVSPCALVLPVIDAAILLVVSVVVCLRVIMPLA